MDRFRSVRVTNVPKRTKHHSSSKVIPINDKRQHENIHIESSSDMTPSTISNHAFQFSSGAIDLRQENKDKKKIFPKGWIISIVTLLILIILAVGIYLIIHFTSRTASTTNVVTPSLRWNTTGVTAAGVGGSPGNNSSQLNTPADVSVDFSNTLYIADYGNNRIQKWLSGASNGTTVAGQASGISGSNATDLQHPAGILVDSTGNIYIADTNNHRIQFWAKGALSGVTIAGTGFMGVNNNQLEFPYFLALNENTKTLYISDHDNNRIMSYASVGTVAAGGNGFGTSYTQLEYPVGLYLDSLTNSLVVANSAAHNIVRWILGDNSWTQVAGISGIQGNSSSLLNLPMGVTFDPMVNTYVADAYNHRIKFFLPDQSEGRTIAGITSSPGMNDIQLNTPYSIRLDNQLNLYVVDLGNHRVQKFYAIKQILFCYRY
ncbi:unnamed protein product [Rotaria socialis]|uniref:NHL repeat containing protein n=4 Tax=Rotaria socialis TaxID=392032 RepID=A0A818BBD5_9BILA|nr:unnamed protein product [Rotaria socialis]